MQPFTASEPTAPNPTQPAPIVAPKHPAFRDFLNRLNGDIVRAFHIRAVDKSQRGVVTLLPYPPVVSPKPDATTVQLPSGVAEALNVEPGQVLIENQDGSHTVLTERAFNELHGTPDDPFKPLPVQANTNAPYNDTAPVAAESTLTEADFPNGVPAAPQPFNEVHETPEVAVPTETVAAQ